MNAPTQLFKHLVIVGVAVLGAVGPVPGTPHNPAGQDPEQQDPEEFRLGRSEQLGEEGHSLRVGDTELIFGSIYEFVGEANDLFVWAWMPTFSGDVGDNAFIGGQNVDVGPEGRIGGDFFLFAQNANLKGQVGGDLYSFVADLTIHEGASIDGAIYGSSGILTLHGTVGGPISFAGASVTINGTVRGDVRLEAGELQLGPNAVIEGDLQYESPRAAEISSGAQVLGQTRHFVPQSDSSDSDEATEQTWFSIWGFLWSSLWLLGSFIVGALALAIGGDAARRPARRLAEQPALGLGFGFVVAVVLPAAAILAMILLITIPLGLISFAIYFVALYLARLVTAQTVGDWLLRLARGGTESSAYAALAIGLILFHFLTRIPYVGFLIWLAALVAGLGGIFLATRRRGAGSSPLPVTMP